MSKTKTVKWRDNPPKNETIALTKWCMQYSAPQGRIKEFVKEGAHYLQKKIRSWGFFSTSLRNSLTKKKKKTISQKEKCFTIKKRGNKLFVDLCTKGIGFQRGDKGWLTEQKLIYFNFFKFPTFSLWRFTMQCGKEVFRNLDSFIS